MANTFELFGSGTLTVTNCTFLGNTATNAGGGISHGTPVHTLTVTNCIFWGNSDVGGMDESAQIHVSTGTPTVNFSDVQGGWTGAGGVGNLNVDPLFVDADDLRLTAGSPCIDAGDNSVVTEPTDLDGNPRIANGTVDMGAYEIEDCNCNGVNDGADILAGTSPDGNSSGIPDECEQAVLYVDADAGGGNNNGTEWAHALTDLQRALCMAADPNNAVTEIWVAEGTYAPTSGASRSATFQLVSGVGVYGGFAGTETLRSQRDPAVHVTTLSGDLGTLSDPTDNSYHVVTGSGTDGTAVLDGFTITAGNANAASFPNNSGAGMMNDNGSPSVINCRFFINQTSSRNSADTPVRSTSPCFCPINNKSLPQPMTAPSNFGKSPLAKKATHSPPIGAKHWRWPSAPTAKPSRQAAGGTTSSNSGTHKHIS